MTDRPDDPASARLAPVTHHRATAIDGVSIFYREAGPADAPVVSYCNTGHLAAANWFVLSEVLGRRDVTLYDGSMSEWTADPGRPVEEG